MAEADALKTIIQGGSFAVLVTILVWIMFKLEPRMSKMITDKDALHAATVEKITEQGRLANEAMVAQFVAMVEKAHADCREDRKERDELLAKEFKLNREARHDVANQMQRVVIELYELNGLKRPMRTAPLNSNKDQS